MSFCGTSYLVTLTMGLNYDDQISKISGEALINKAKVAKVTFMQRIRKLSCR